MKKEIKPGVAAAIVAVVVLLIGAAVYMKSNSMGKVMKPADALKQAGFKDQLRAAYQEKYGGGH
jgi:hypothetical protein